MSSNYPPGVSESSKDAPWNQEYPSDDEAFDSLDLLWQCKSCGFERPGPTEHTPTGSIMLCPECGIIGPHRKVWL